MLVPLRKAAAGADSYGHVWDTAGAVVDVEYDEALVLLAIPDGGFSVAETPPPEPEPNDHTVEEPAPEHGEFSESPAPRRRGRPPKARHDDGKTVEE